MHAILPLERLLISMTADTYTLIVSAFEPGQTGLFSLSLEATAPVSIIPIAAEGAGMYNRVINGSW